MEAHAKRHSPLNHFPQLRPRIKMAKHGGVLFAAQAGRCLHADEMGLCKTIWAISLQVLGDCCERLGEIRSGWCSCGIQL
jgi:hypothetical protein